MESLTVLEQLPEAYKLKYVPLLYNQPAFLSASTALPQLHFYLADSKTRQVLAHIGFGREESEVLSPCRAPFGGVEHAPDLGRMVMLFFLQEVCRRLSLHNVRFVKIKTPPAFYLPEPGLVPESLTTLGFDEKARRKYHAIKVDNVPLADKMAQMERRRLKKAHKEQLTFRFASRQEFSSIYDFIRQQRETRSQSLSLGWQELKMVIRENEGCYFFATVYRQGQLIAASLLVKASSHAIYSFYPAHDIAFNQLSPMVFLLDALYAWCREQSIRYIDLGTSYLGREVNRSLATFKEHMGGQEFVSASFRKALSS